MDTETKKLSKKLGKLLDFIKEENEYLSSLQKEQIEAKIKQDYRKLAIIDEELEAYDIDPSLFVALEVENKLFLLNNSTYESTLSEKEYNYIVRAFKDDKIMFCNSLLDFVLEDYAAGVLNVKQLHMLLKKMFDIATEDDFDKLDTLREKIKANARFELDDVVRKKCVSCIHLISDIKLEALKKQGFSIVD